jgi:thiol:disulfide interchange protein
MTDKKKKTGILKGLVELAFAAFFLYHIGKDFLAAGKQIMSEPRSFMMLVSLGAAVFTIWRVCEIARYRVLVGLLRLVLIVFGGLSVLVFWMARMSGESIGTNAVTMVLFIAVAVSVYWIVPGRKRSLNEKPTPQISSDASASELPYQSPEKKRQIARLLDALEKVRAQREEQTGQGSRWEIDEDEFSSDEFFEKKR